MERRSSAGPCKPPLTIAQSGISKLRCRESLSDKGLIWSQLYRKLRHPLCTWWEIWQPTGGVFFFTLSCRRSDRLESRSSFQIWSYGSSRHESVNGSENKPKSIICLIPVAAARNSLPNSPCVIILHVTWRETLSLISSAKSPHIGVSSPLLSLFHVKMASFTTEAFSELAVGLTVIGIRTGVRLNLVGIKGFQIDDYLMLVAAVCLAFISCISFHHLFLLTNNTF